MTEAVLLASGGLDSTTMAYALCQQDVRFTPLFIDYGQHNAVTEWRTLLKVLPPGASTPERVDVSSVYRGSSSALIRERDLWNEEVKDQDLYLPYRNSLLLCVGAAFAESRAAHFLYSAFINSNHARELDCSLDFFARLGAIMSSYGAVELRLPFKGYSKADVLATAIKLGVPVGLTYSCQASSDIPCGACPNCVERLEALRGAPTQNE